MAKLLDSDIYKPEKEFIGLTDDEMLQIYLNNHINKYENIKMGMGRAIEAKLKEKNTVTER